MDMNVPAGTANWETRSSFLATPAAARRLPGSTAARRAPSSRRSIRALGRSNNRRLLQSVQFHIGFSKPVSHVDCAFEACTDLTHGDSVTGDPRTRSGGSLDLVGRNLDSLLDVVGDAVQDDKHTGIEAPTPKRRVNVGTSTAGLDDAALDLQQGAVCRTNVPALLRLRRELALICLCNDGLGQVTSRGVARSGPRALRRCERCAWSPRYDRRGRLPLALARAILGARICPPSHPTSA
jgi:hypothetical protein